MRARRRRGRTTAAPARRSRASTSASTPSTASSSSSPRTPATTSSSARSRATRPGYKENAGIFCHNNTWIHLGWCLLGEGDRALEYYLSICPSAKEDRIETYRGEPYVYAQMIAGRDAADAGRGEELVAHRHRGVDASSTLAQGILGIKPDYDGLRIDPCIPHGLARRSASPAASAASSTRSRCSNPDGVCERRPLADGRRPRGRRQPRPARARAASRVEVEVVLGGDRR